MYEVAVVIMNAPHSFTFLRGMDVGGNIFFAERGGCDLPGMLVGWGTAGNGNGCSTVDMC